MHSSQERNTAAPTFLIIRFISIGMYLTVTHQASTILLGYYLESVIISYRAGVASLFWPADCQCLESDPCRFSFYH